jgi:hypothetical protein
LRAIAYTLLALLILPVLAPIAMAGHPDRCSGCHYELYWDPGTGVKKGDLVTDVGGVLWWSHDVYTVKAWYQCVVCHTGIARTIAETVHANIGCACHAVIHAPKFDANAEPWFAWVATTLIAIPTIDLEELSAYLGATVERAVAGTTGLPAYKPIAGARVEDLARVLLKLPADTPTNYPKYDPETKTLIGYYTLKEYFNLIDGFDGGDYPSGAGYMSYGVEVQLLTWRYKPVVPWIFIPGVGWMSGWPGKGPVTGGPVILALGTRTVPAPAGGPYSGYAHPYREAWLVCYNCHFVTAEPVAAGALRFVEGFWLIGIPEVALTLPAHGITREALMKALAPEAPVTVVPEVAFKIVQALLVLFATITGVALIWVSRRMKG